ncbi:MAG: hypothetical protein AMQ22_00925 [Candidatus Methanofastidiosum methylothiophilum]|uniref:Uncharacterized protein n=1 Tax=Candidatus Methanofastidiosum methylothiophilum TaxID=1705564 RepID=A0A150J535_9EURY|nr:MAG: hypothetical protein AMQ22_00925 [Candidatus Methanofastidiosum methylthiophilus]
MNKRYISLSIILFIAIGTLPALFANGENDIPIGRFFGKGEDGINQCYEIKLLQSVNETLQPGQSATYYLPGGILDGCIYILEIRGRDLCIEGCADFNSTIKLKNGKEEGEDYRSCNGGSVEEIIDTTGDVWREVEYIKITNKQNSDCAITYTWNFYSACPCKGKQALYPKVDIEQFSVTGGATIIRDGKILTNFNVLPGVQQTFIQVENRGFFTQNDVKVKVTGLPQGVSVSITPDTQKIKAHNLGTYQATFEVGPNVPSGTYKVTMMAYSENGVFDTLQIDLIVP